MAMVRRPQRTSAQLAASRALDADIERAFGADDSPYGDRAAFVAADLASPDLVSEYHAAGVAVVIVDERGTERFLPVPS